ncbi:hypothetical protein N5V81_12885 [Escherichia coli]|nr:hypothetical protein [Escherichia coli]
MAGAISANEVAADPSKTKDMVAVIVTGPPTNPAAAMGAPASPMTRVCRQQIT